MDKIASLQQKSGLRPANARSIPLRKVSPGDVFTLILDLQRELLRVHDKLGVAKAISKTRLIPGKLPSDVYQNLWKASYALDGLIPALTPGHVYRNGQYVLAELKTISKKLGKSAQAEAKMVTNRKITPKDVLVESFRNLYRVAKLKRKLGVAPFAPPSFPIGNITPSDPFDASSMLIAELVRIKTALGISTTYERLPLAEGKKPGDVLLVAANAGDLLDKLSVQ